jgi:hypothetical protein
MPNADANVEYNIDAEDKAATIKPRRKAVLAKPDRVAA